MPNYVIDENNNRVEGYSKEEVLAVLAQAIANGSLDNIEANSAFASKLKCCVSGGTYQIAFITQAMYNELVAANNLVENTYYFIIDDTTCEDINEALEELNKALAALQKTVNSIGGKQQILDSNLSDAYIYKDKALARADISTLMKTGKTKNDVIGIGGSLLLYDEATISYNILNFASLCGGSITYTGEINVLFKGEANKYYILNVSIGIDSANKLYASSTPILYCLTDNTTITVTSIKIDTLNIFYK